MEDGGYVGGGRPPLVLFSCFSFCCFGEDDFFRDRGNRQSCRSFLLFRRKRADSFFAKVCEFFLWVIKMGFASMVFGRERAKE